MLLDTRIIQRKGCNEVLAEALAVPFICGGAVRLHRVRKSGVDDTFLRAIEYTPDPWAVFDLRAVARPLDLEFRQYRAADHDGLALYTLRQMFDTADDFIARAVPNFVAAWMSSPATLTLPPAPPAASMTLQPELRAA